MPHPSTEPAEITLIFRTLGRWPLMDRAIHGVLAQTSRALADLIVCAPEPLLPMVRAWFLGYASRLQRPVHFLADSPDNPQKSLADAIDSLAKGKLLAFLDDDDLWPPDHLDNLLANSRPGQCTIAAGRLVHERLTYEWLLKEEDSSQTTRLEAASMSEIWNDLAPPMSCWLAPREVLLPMLRAIPASLPPDLATQLATMALLQGHLALADGAEVLVSHRPSCAGHAPYANASRGSLRAACSRILQGLCQSSAGPESSAAATIRSLASAVCVAPLPAAPPKEKANKAKPLPDVDSIRGAKPKRAGSGFFGSLLPDLRLSLKKNPPPGKKQKFAPGFKRFGLVSPSGLQRADVKSALQGKKRLTLDIFDTTLARRIARPADLFLRIGEQAGTLPGVVDPRHFWALRIAAEREARIRCKSTRGHDEPGLQDIYDVLAQWCAWDAGITSHVRDIELANEDQFLYPIPVLGKIIADARQAGCEVWFLSDMYHSSETIGAWLRSRNLDFDGLHVSCEEGANKASGELFTKLAETRQWNLEDQAHVGDNSVSDVSAPAKHGIEAFRFRDTAGNRPLIDQVHVPAHNDLDFGFSLAVGLAREYRRRMEPGDFASRQHWMMAQLGYEVGGVLSLGFSHWLLQRARALGLQRLHFLGRDGWLFQQVARKTAAAWQVPVETDYLHGSRRLFELTCLADWNEAEQKSLCFPVPGMTVADWLDRLQLTWQEAAQAAAQCGFSDPHQVLADPFFRAIDPKISQRLLQLMQKLRQPIQHRARAASDRLERYVRHHRILPGESAIVDLGWAGSSARNFQRLAKRIGGPATRLRAFYFGSWDLARKAINDGCQLDAWHFSLKPFKASKDLTPPATRHEVALESIPLLEMLFSSTEPSVLGLTENGPGAFDPVFAAPEFGPEELDLLAAFHHGALQFTDDFLQILPTMPDHLALDVYAEYALKRFLSLPSPEEAQLFSRFIPREEHIAGTPVRTLCTVPAPDPAIDRRAQLIAAYEACMWKKGFRTQLDTSDHKLLPANL